MPGLAWSVFKAPSWSTGIKKSVSGREFTTAYWSYPKWEFRLNYEVLRAGALAELETLIGFFNARNGRADDWLFEDPRDKTVTAQNFGTGDGVRTQFQLVRALGGFVEPIFGVSGTPSIFKNGVLQSSGYSIDSKALVTFTTPPANAVALTWTGSFYFRVRFTHDSAEFEEFLQDLWHWRRCQFSTFKP